MYILYIIQMSCQKGGEPLQWGPIQSERPCLPSYQLTPLERVRRNKAAQCWVQAHKSAAFMEGSLMLEHSTKQPCFSHLCKVILGVGEKHNYVLPIKAAKLLSLVNSSLASHVLVSGREWGSMQFASLIQCSQKCWDIWLTQYPLWCGSQVATPCKGF